MLRRSPQEEIKALEEGLAQLEQERAEAPSNKDLSGGDLISSAIEAARKLDTGIGGIVAQLDRLSVELLVIRESITEVLEHLEEDDD